MKTKPNKNKQIIPAAIYIVIAIKILFAAYPVHGETPENKNKYNIEWGNTYYYGDTLKIKIPQTDVDAEKHGKIEIWSAPPIGEQRKVSEKIFDLKTKETIVELIIDFDLMDYVLKQEAIAAVAEMNIENKEEQEDMVKELLPGGKDGVFEQFYYLKLFIDGELQAESNKALIVAMRIL
jgi:hypothetical protein